MDWFLYDRDLRHEGVQRKLTLDSFAKVTIILFLFLDNLCIETVIYFSQVLCNG